VRLNRRLREVASRRQEAFGSPFRAGGGVDLGLFAYRERYLAWLEAQKRRLAEELAAREKTRREVQAKYLEASKERKVLTKLKERRAAEHHRDTRREEFKVQDDITGSRIGRPER
jgi:flagellar FliJ protein